MELEEEATGFVRSKLKIPNPPGEEEKQQQDQEDEEQEQEGVGTVGAAAGTRVCELCGKVFRSGKALGGHMRMHSQYSQPADRNWNSNRSRTAAAAAAAATHFTANTTTTTTTTTTKASDDTTPPICCLCGKNFLSMKALFGHMRSHPEREWRGIQPPAPPSLPPATTAAATAKTTTSSSTLSDDDQIADSASAATAAVDCHHHRDVDLSKSLYGCSWPVSTKRGRSGSVISSSKTVEKKNEAEAVSDLLMLSRRGSTTIDKEDQEFNFRNTKRPDDDDDDVDKGKANYELRHVGEDSCNSDSQNSESINAMGNMKNNTMNMMMMKKKRRKMKLADLEEERGVMVGNNANNDNNNRSYTCNICNKSFPTHQALGGHMSSHNNSVNNITKMVINPHSHSYRVHYYDHNHHQSTYHEDNPQDHHRHHQCKICKKMFPTGQALGGHKRSHWHNNINNNSPVEVLADRSTSLSPGEASQTTNRLQPVISFDLNELPPMEEEDDNDNDNDNDDYVEQVVSTSTLTLQVS